MSNALLRAQPILNRAIYIVRDRTPPDAAPFRITAEFEFMSMDLTNHMDGFAERILIPAIDRAMAHKRPDDGKPLVDVKGVDMFVRYDHDGISGCLIRRYDITNDRFLTRIEIRAGLGS
jgi:hypothetical protein